MKFDTERLMRRCYLIMAFIFYGFNLVSICVTIFAFVAPDSPEMISSVLSDRSTSTLILCGLFQGYVEYMFHSLCFLNIFVFFGSVFTPWVVLSEIR